MLKRLFNAVRLYIFKINIYIFPDKRESVEATEKEFVPQGEQSGKSGAMFIRSGFSSEDECFKKRDVLLGVFRNVSQFEVCISNNFYYIPYDLIEGSEELLEYVALYQSRNLFGYDAGVRYFGKITSYEIIPREDIEEISSENEGLYCRFNVDKWIELDNIIYPREIGFIREYTTMFLLKNSREVPQLLISSMTEFKLYNAVSMAVEYRQKVSLGNLLLFTRKGFLLVFNGSELTHFYPEKEFRIRPGATIKSMIRDLNM